MPYTQRFYSDVDLMPSTNKSLQLIKKVPTFPGMGLAAVGHTDQIDCVISRQKVTVA
jgi:hypothetical protein